MHSILLIGRGAFGSALNALLNENSHDVTTIDVGETAEQAYDIVILAVPTQMMRTALCDNRIAFTSETIVISSAKGIEAKTGLLPHEIFDESIRVGSYYALSGPSFAHEIIAKVPTVVDLAPSTNEIHQRVVRELFSCSYFHIESHPRVFDVELAGALKNVYAIAAGFLAGVGGGANTHAHLQVVALREYATLVKAFSGNGNVVCPSVVGDLHLTSSSVASRNYRYGLERARGGVLVGETVEGANSVAPLLARAHAHHLSLPLAEAVGVILEKGVEAKKEVLHALGFKLYNEPL